MSKNEDYIKSEFSNVRNLIVENQFSEAIEKLKALIDQIDGFHVKESTERKLDDQLIILESQHNEIINEELIGARAPGDDYKINKIRASLLALINSIEEIALKDPNYFSYTHEGPSKPNPDNQIKEEQNETPDVPPIENNPQDTTPPDTKDKDSSAEESNDIIYKDKDGSTLIIKGAKDPKITITDDETVIDLSANDDAKAVTASHSTESSGAGPAWLKWLAIPLLLLLAIFLFFIRGCDSCSNKGDIPPPIVNPVDSSGIKQNQPPPKALGKNGKEMAFEAGSKTYEMADFLSAPTGTTRKKFDLDDINFSSNSARMNGGKKQLDDLTALLKEYPNARIEIYGHIDGKEEPSYQGNKEITLSDVRAKNVYEALAERGIPEERMDFEGYGSSEQLATPADSRRVEVMIFK